MRRLRSLFGVLTVAAVMAAPLAARADHTRFTVALDASTAYGDAVVLTGRLMDSRDWCDDQPCPDGNEQVDFYVDGTYVGTDVTNNGGWAYLIFQPGGDLHVGMHQIEVRYDRFDNEPPAVSTATLAIVHETTVVTAREGYLEAEVLDDDATPVAGVRVRFDLSGPLGPQEVCTAFTDASGVARCLPVSGAGVTPADLEQVSYVATFDGDGDHTGSSDDAHLI